MNKYEGYWQNSLYHGKGNLIDDEGKYDGDFINGIREGKGIQIYMPEGDVYEGDFKDDDRHGVGKYIHSHGQVY